MGEFNFGSLTDIDFELLALDVIEKLLGLELERFKPGKDQGIDGRYIDNHGRITVIQAKHFWKSGTKALIQYCKNKEAPKLEKLNIERYLSLIHI